MFLILIALIAFFVVRFLIISIGEIFIPKETKDNTTFIIHNHNYQNHLHISKEDLKSFIDK